MTLDLVFLKWHVFIFFILLVFLFIGLSNPIHNIFFFMLICIQSFIFLAMFPRQHFFAFLLLIIYLGAIAVLFLFVVLVIGNSTFVLENKKENFLSFSSLENNVFYFVFVLFFLNVSLVLFSSFYDWVMDFEIESDLNTFLDYIEYVRNLNNLFFKNPKNLDLFLFLEKNSSCFNLFYNNNIKGLNIHSSSLENIYYIISDSFCKPEMFSFFDNTYYSQVKVFGATLFLSNAGILYLCAFLLFLSTLGVIVLIVSRKQLLKTFN